MPYIPSKGAVFTTSPPAALRMIVVDHLAKSFPIGYGLTAWVKHRGKPPRKTVLHDINLTADRGELLGLLGPNGAGKTTLLKLIATQSIPDCGTILIGGIDVVKQPKLAKQKIGLCPSEERSFYFRLTARANLEFFGALIGLRGRTLARRIEEVIELVELGAAIDQRFESFSSGMRQRLTVARALLGDPDVLLLDEPTRAVDPVHAEEIRQFIRRELVNRCRKTVILATNLLEEAWRLCDRVAVVNKGSIVALGPPGSLDAELHRVSRYQITFDQLDDTWLAKARAVPGLTVTAVMSDSDGVTVHVEIEESAHSLTDFVRAVSRNGAVVRALKSVEPHPVDVFRRVTMEKNEQ